MKVVTTVYRRMMLLAHDFTLPDPAARGSRWTVRWLTAGDLDAYCAFRPAAGRRLIEARWARGHEACAIWLDGRIIHAAWVATRRGPSRYLRRDVVLAEREAMTYDTYTAISHRRQGCLKARVRFLVGEFRARGYIRFLSLVAVENRVGYRALNAAGYHPIGRYHSIGLGPWRHSWPVGADLPALVSPRAE
jgi:hypothetical protein